MVAVIKAGSSIRNALLYNENKVVKEQAILLQASNFGKDKEELRLGDKFRHFQKLTSLNERTKINSIHISLNFDPSEKLSGQKLVSIAEDYIRQIGFANQPYLVYQHHDAGHPHIHIVTTNIQCNGNRISLHNIGRNQSETARKEIEIKYGLVQASGRQSIGSALKPVESRKVQYGKSETKRAIANVLDAILPYYKYTSLAELNAVLKQYNMTADHGSETSRIRQRKGLVYRIVNERGEKVGVPIKASSIYNKPTLKTIEARFAQNDQQRKQHKQRLINTVDFSFRNQHPTLKALQQSLSKEQINMVLRQNNSGVIYGITYIDHQTKCVFNGSDLGKAYSANAIQQRCQQKVSQQQPKVVSDKQKKEFAKTEGNSSSHTISDIFHQLTDNASQSLPLELKEEANRKKRKQKRQQ